MTITDWIGSVGVTILLIAYFLNLTGKIASGSLTYIILNTVGAALSCLASVLLKYLPFIVLEATWTCVSLFSLIKYQRKKL